MERMQDRNISGNITMKQKIMLLILPLALVFLVNDPIPAMECDSRLAANMYELFERK